MFEAIVSDDRFRAIMRKHCFDTIEYLTNTKNFFSFFCYIHQVSFTPPLPENIKDTLKHLTLFSMSGYTFDSIKLTEKSIEFEAGFGEDNFASIITVPLNAILQLTVEDNVIFVNSGSSIEKKHQQVDKTEMITSISAILSNPKNKNLKYNNNQ